MNDSDDHPLPQDSLTTSTSARNNNGNGVRRSKRQEKPSTTMGSTNITSTTSTSSNQDGLRRSKRERTPTTIQIDGHTILLQNNYIVQGNDYIFGTHQQDRIIKKERKIARKNPNRSMSQAQKERKGQRLDRERHNQIIKNNMAEDEKRKWEFLGTKWDILTPFVGGDVRRKLSQSVPTSLSSSSSTVVEYEVNVQPESVTTKLRDYQQIGLEWMVNMFKKGLPMILGDEMGLGKTLQSISLLAYIKEHSSQTNAGPSLVVCPLSVLYSWCNEVEKHAPSLQYFRLHASGEKERQDQRQTMMKDILSYDIIVTTYEMVKSSEVQSIIRGLYFNCVILDEGHVIKDSRTQISEVVRKLHSRNKLILTGTPLQNNLVELFCILNYLYPDVIKEVKFFEDAFDILHNSIDDNMLLKANKLLNLFMLRRLKEEVEKLMPKKIETKILCPLSTSQIFWYKGCLMKDINFLMKCDSDGPKNTSAVKYSVLRNLVMQLRKCCLHPFLFDGAETNVEETTLEELIASSGKLAVLDKILRSMYQNGNRTVIFSQFTSMLDILEDYCVMRGWKFARFDGSTPRAQRNYLINQFNAPGSEYFIFLMSTRSGSLGINLQTADTCILYDSDWNPQPDIQAMARVHRIGQKKIVHVYRLVSSGTVEERVLQRAEKKLYLDKMVNRGVGEQMDESGDGGGLSTSELLSDLKFGSNAVFCSTNDLPSDKEIAAVTDRQRSEETSVTGLLQGGAAQTAKDFDSRKELADSQTFEGVNFRAIRDSQEALGVKKVTGIQNLKEEWRDLNTLADPDGGRGKRHKKNRLLDIKDCNGTTHKVFSTNNYDLENGEPSVFENETRKTVGMSNPKNKVKKLGFINQSHCQICGDGGGTIIECPRCPMSVHQKCCGLKPNEFMVCSHHRCALCSKTCAGAGGLLFACQSCPNAFCEDCIPSKGVRYLGKTTPAFLDLGYEGHPRTIYIHCSKQCEHYAKAELDWKEPESQKMQCPNEIDVSYSFGANALSVQEIAKRRAPGLPLHQQMKSNKSIIELE